MTKTSEVLSAAVLLLASAGSAVAGDRIAEHYTRTGAGETLIAPFTAWSTSSQQSYAGPVEVEVSGLGFSLGNRLNDAFYFDGGEPTFGFYLLNIGWDGAALVPAVSGRNAANAIAFIEGVGAVPLGTRPAYAADHVYRFVIEVPADAGALQFGVSDGFFDDNGGAYTLRIWQLQAGVVPEPATAALWLAGLGLLAAGHRRARAVGG